MNIRSLLMVAVASLITGVASAASVFPEIIDNPAGPPPYAPYDGVENSLSFSVSGFFTDVTDPALPIGIDISAGDELLVYYEMTSNSGGMPTGLGIVLTADVAAGGASLTSSGGGTNSTIGSIFTAGQLSDFSAGAIAAADAVLVSGPLSVGAITPGNLGTVFGSLDVEAVLDLGASAVGGGPGLLSIDLFAGLGVLEFSSMWPTTNFLPVVEPLLGITDDWYVAGSSATAPGTGLSAPGTALTTTTLGGTSLGATNPIPEPGSILAVLGCVAGAGAMGRKRRRNAKQKV